MSQGLYWRKIGWNSFFFCGDLDCSWKAVWQNSDGFDSETVICRLICALEENWGESR